MSDEPGKICDIGWAVSMLRGDHHVRRAGWNGKGMFIKLMPRLEMVGENTPYVSEAYIMMLTGVGQWQPGWLCSQADLLATDWEIAT